MRDVQPAGASQPATHPGPPLAAAGLLLLLQLPPTRRTSRHQHHSHPSLPPTYQQYQSRVHPTAQRAEYLCPNDCTQLVHRTTPLGPPRFPLVPTLPGGSCHRLRLRLRIHAPTHTYIPRHRRTTCPRTRLRLPHSIGHRCFLCPAPCLPGRDPVPVAVRHPAAWSAWVRSETPTDHAAQRHTTRRPPIITEDPSSVTSGDRRPPRLETPRSQLRQPTQAQAPRRARQHAPRPRIHRRPRWPPAIRPSCRLWITWARFRLASRPDPDRELQPPTGPHHPESPPARGSIRAASTPPHHNPAASRRQRPPRPDPRGD